MLIALSLLAASWLLIPREWQRKRLVASLLITALCIVGYLVKPANVVAIVDTPSATYKISDVPYKVGLSAAIAVGPGGLQSGIYTDGSKELAFEYTRKLAEVVDAAPHKDKILILGGGETYTARSIWRSGIRQVRSMSWRSTPNSSISPGSTLAIAIRRMCGSSVRMPGCS